jgi:hypothetical protein
MEMRTLVSRVAEYYRLMLADGVSADRAWDAAMAYQSSVILADSVKKDRDDEPWKEK